MANEEEVDGPALDLDKLTVELNLPASTVDEIARLDRQIESLRAGMENLLGYTNRVHRDVLKLLGQPGVTAHVTPYVGQEGRLELGVEYPAPPVALLQDRPDAAPSARQSYDPVTEIVR